MDWVNIIGSISGIIALLTLAFFTGRYISKIEHLCKTQTNCPIADVAIKIDSIWGMKDALSAAIIKIDTLWKIYVEDNLIKSSNPGEKVVLPDELKGEIEKQLNGNHYLSEISEPTLLVVNRIGLERFIEVAKTNKTSLGHVMVEANIYVLDCLKKQ